MSSGLPRPFSAANPSLPAVTFVSASHGESAARDDRQSGLARHLSGLRLRLRQRLPGDESRPDRRRHHSRCRHCDGALPHPGLSRRHSRAKHHAHRGLGRRSAGSRRNLHDPRVHDGRHRRPASVDRPALALLGSDAHPAGGRLDWRVFHHSSAPPVVRGRAAAVARKRGELRDRQSRRSFGDAKRRATSSARWDSAGSSKSSPTTKARRSSANTSKAFSNSRAPSSSISTSTRSPSAMSRISAACRGPRPASRPRSSASATSSDPSSLRSTCRAASSPGGF